jgi:hypothetical protein
MGEMRYTYKILIRKPQRKILLEEIYIYVRRTLLKCTLEKNRVWTSVN